MKIVLQVEKKCFFIDKRSTIFCDDLDESDNLGSDEESGKSWSELEEEARKGWLKLSKKMLSSLLLLADAEKLDYESDHGGRGKKKGGGVGTSSKKRSPVQSKKRPAHSPPSNQTKKKKK